MKALREFVDNELGLPGVIAIALIAGCAAFYFTGLRPAEAERTQLSAQAVRAPSPVRPAGMETRDALGRFYGRFAPAGSALGALRTVLGAAAAEGIAVDIGEYRVSRERSTPLARYEIVLPVKASYPALRRFIGRALAEVPGLALDELALRRESISATVIEARVQLSLYVDQR